MKKFTTLVCILGLLSFVAPAFSANNQIALGKRDKAHGVYSIPDNHVALGKRDKAHGLYSIPDNHIALGKRDKAHG